MRPPSVSTTRPLPFLLAGAAVSLAGIRLAAFDLYWTAETVIMASDIDGGNVTEVFDGTGMDDWAVDVVAADDHIYWGDRNGGNLWRADRDGSDAQIIFENDGTFSSLHYLALDLDNERIFVTDHQEGVFELDLADESVSELFSGQGVSQFTGLALRSSEELIWFNAGNNWMYRTNLLTGDTPEGDAIELAAGPTTYGMAYDSDGDVLYYTDFNSGVLHAYDFASGEDTLLAEGFSNLLGVRLSPSGTHLVIVERDVGIHGYQLETGGRELLVEAEDAHFGVAVTADPGELEVPVEPLQVVWSLSPGDRDYLSSGTNERGMALHPDEGYLLVVRRGNPPIVGIVDEQTGDHLGTLSVEGVSGGFSNFHLNKIAIAEDGAIYACNMTIDTADENFRLYRWEHKDADPELVFNGALNGDDNDSNNRRFGDSIVVLGTGENQEILFDSWQGTVWGRLTPLPEGEITDPENRFEVDIVTLEGIGGGDVRDIVAGPDGFIYGTRAGSGNDLLEIELDRNSMTASVNRSFGGDFLPAHVGPVGFDLENGFIGGIHAFGNEFYLYTWDDFQEIASRSYPTDNNNEVRVGVVIFGNGMVYALNTTNGIMAMDLGLEPDTVTFADWIAQFELPEGQDGPGDDPDGDGVSNLVEYALGGDPAVPDRTPLPVQGFEIENGDRFLSLAVNRNPESTGVNLVVEVSSDLETWDSGPEHTTVLVDTASERVVRDNAAVTGADRRFIRLRVVEE